MNIAEDLIEWYKNNHRILPWRETKNPYKIWLAEIILQQTRVEQGFSYYYKFVKEYPAIPDLAAASLDEILKLWQGLGYYNRAVNMHATAKKIVNIYNGKFPESYNELLNLKGIGHYTAAAIASLAFNIPVASIDGNVYRFLARLFGIDATIESYSGKNIFLEYANKLLDKKQPGLFNQAIIEFGALQCIPRNPNCINCLFNKICYAYTYDKVDYFPVKKKKTQKKERYFYYLVTRDKKHMLLNRRTKNDIWSLLYEFPLIEVEKKLTQKRLFNHLPFKALLNTQKKYSIKKISKTYTHFLSHQVIYAQFLNILTENLVVSNNFFKININNLNEYAFPQLIVKYLKDEGIDYL